MKLGEVLAARRRARNMTLRDLSDESGVSNPLISQIETGRVKNPGIFTVVKLADALGLSMSKLATCDH